MFREHTIGLSTNLGHNIANTNVDDTEEALVLLLELLLVKDLHCQNAVFIDTATRSKRLRQEEQAEDLSVQVEALVPIWI